MSRFVYIFILLALVSCSRTARKEKKCAEAREKIIKLSFDVEARLGKLVPEKERWSEDRIRKSIERRVDPDGRFVSECMKNLSQEALDCIGKAKKLSELGRCMEQ
jgi:hypothetical protein